MKAAFSLSENKAIKDVKKFNPKFLLSDQWMLQTFRTNDFIKSPRREKSTISLGEQILTFDFIIEETHFSVLECCASYWLTFTTTLRNKSISYP